jgi:hypothetical protein
MIINEQLKLILEQGTAQNKRLVSRLKYVFNYFKVFFIY